MKRVASGSPLLAALAAWMLPALSPAAPSTFLERNPTAQVTMRTGSAAPSLVTGLDIALPSGDPARTIGELLVREADFLGFDAARTTLEPLEPRTAGSIEVYRYTQHHQGLPVLGADIAVTVDARQHIRMIGSSLVQLGAMRTRFSVLSSDAVNAAIDGVRPARWSGTPRLVRQAIARVAGEWKPVWEVQLSATQPLGSFHVWVDAETGAMLRTANRVAHLKKGYAYPSCPEAGTYTPVDLVNIPSTTNLSGAYVDLYSNCSPGSCASSSRAATPDGNGDYYIAPNEGSPSDGFAEVHTFYHLNQMHDRFAAMGFRGLDFQMRVAVNFALNSFGGEQCNATYYFNDSTILVGLCNLERYGLGTGAVNFAYDAVVVMHEYTHGAVDHGAALDFYDTDDWGLVGQQMGLHEGFADFFPAVVLDDPRLGRHIGPAFGLGPSMRSLTDFRSCPDDIDGESHYDGQIWSSANWEAYVAKGKSPEIPLVVFQGLLGLSSRPTFQDAANAVLGVAAISHSTVYSALSDAYTTHGLLGCGREVEIANGRKMKGHVTNPYDLGLSGSSSSPFELQYKIVVPANASSLSFDIHTTDSGGNTVSNLVVYVNYGSHVAYQGSAASWSKTSSFSITNPAAGPYYILPVGVSMADSTYNFEITATYQVGGFNDGGLPSYPDAGLVEPDASGSPDVGSAPDAASEPEADASSPAGPDAAASEPDAGADASAIAGSDAQMPVVVSGCGCGVGGHHDSVAGSLAFLAGLAFASSVSRRRRGR